MIDWDSVLKRIMLGKGIKAFFKSYPSRKRLFPRVVALKTLREGKREILHGLLDIAKRKRQGQL